jgi:hypothetical protein
MMGVMVCVALRRRVLVGLVLAVVLTGVLGGCREDDGDQRVLDELGRLDVLGLPDGATRLARDDVAGGGSDVVSIRGASSVTIVYATSLDPAEVAGWYHATYGDTWTLRDNGYAPPGGRALGGPRRPDDGTSVRVEARPAQAGDTVPAGTAAVVTVVVARTRD